ncbi:MAG: 3-(3-hydroxy-phenyl)propionate hydroxylase [Hyphomicrobiaceae bacterium]
MQAKGSPANPYDVAIVGYGPVGAALANLLGLYGINVLVLDREGPAYHLPRAVHFDDEVMRVIQTIGIADEMAECVHVNPGMKFIDSDGNLLLEWPRPPEISAQGWHPSYRFHQPDLERLLRNALNRFASVDVRTRCDVVAIKDRGDNVELTVNDLTSGETTTLVAKYVVGCDGARSFVRDVISSGLEDYGFHERWLVVDVLLRKPKQELGDFSIQHCDANRPATYVRGTGNRRRWEITVHPDETDADLTSAAGTWQLLSPWLSSEEADIERSAVYTFHSCIAKKWRDGRLLIAGDAAHQTPPFMGQGLCAGIRDAANLAWKLTAVVRNKVSDDLLDTYQSERHPHIRAYVEMSVKLGQLINMADPTQAIEAAFPRPDGSAKMTSLAPTLGPGVGLPGLANIRELAPQLQLSSGQRIDDISGYQFVLICEEPLLNETNVNLSELTAFGLHVVSADKEPAAATHLSSLKVRAVVIRPDRYTLGRANSPHELAALCCFTRSLIMPLTSL